MSYQFQKVKIEQMFLTPARALAGNDIADVGHRKPVLQNTSRLCRVITFDAIGRMH